MGPQIIKRGPSIERNSFIFFNFCLQISEQKPGDELENDAALSFINGDEYRSVSKPTQHKHFIYF